MIVQNVATDGTTEVSFTVAKGDLPETLRAAEAAAREIGATGVTHDADVAKVSVVGLGMRTHTGVATTMFEALADGRDQHPDDHDQRDQDQRAGRSGLGRAGAPRRAPGLPARRGPRPTPAGVLPRRSPTTRAMKLVPLADHARPPSPGSRGWKTSSSPASSSTRRRPGSPSSTCPTGPATRRRVFRAIAEAGVFVDMIVQNVEPRRRFGPLVHRAPRRRRRGPSTPCGRSPAGEVSVEPAMAKLSVIGVGMRTHTGVATRMFGALAERGDQHQPDQHQRGPHQRRHRRRQGQARGSIA